MPQINFFLSAKGSTSNDILTDVKESTALIYSRCDILCSFLFSMKECLLLDAHHWIIHGYDLTWMPGF